MDGDFVQSAGPALLTRRHHSRRALLRQVSSVSVGVAAVEMLGVGFPTVLASTTGTLNFGAARIEVAASTPAATPVSRVESDPEVLVTGYDSPEGPAFDLGGNLFFVNWLSSSILKITQDGHIEEWFNTGGIPAGLAFHPDGSLYVADEGDQIHGIMRITPDRVADILVNEYQGKPLNGANDLVFDQDGVLYFTDPWGSWTSNSIGSFYRLFPDGVLEQLDTELAFPNGVAIAIDGSAVFIGETGHNRVLKYELRDDGTVGPRQSWADLEPANGGPDGMEFDVNGDLYVAHYGTGHIDVLDSAGNQIDQIDIPGKELTNVAFGEAGNRSIIVTDVETASLYRVRLKVAGQPLHDGRKL